jgi:hypothetical protein
VKKDKCYYKFSKFYAYKLSNFHAYKTIELQRSKKRKSVAKASYRKKRKDICGWNFSKEKEEKGVAKLLKR